MRRVRRMHSSHSVATAYGHGPLQRQYIETRAAPVQMQGTAGRQCAIGELTVVNFYWIRGELSIDFREKSLQRVTFRHARPNRIAERKLSCRLYRYARRSLKDVARAAPRTRSSNG